MTSKRKMPVKTTELDFAEDGYPGFHCEAWVNLPLTYIRRYAAVDGADSADADDLFLKLFPSWDFVDFDGKPIPHTAEGAGAIPPDLAGAMMRQRAEALRNGALPAPLGSGSSNAPSDSEKG